MMVRGQLVKTCNTVICIGATFFAARMFLSSTIAAEIFFFLMGIISSRVDLSIFNLSISLLKTAFLASTLVFVFLNLWGGKSSNVMRIYFLDLLLILPEVFAHSKFQWLQIFFGLDVYNPSKTFTETLFVALIIVGGYMLLFFDSMFRENSEGFLLRGVNLGDIDLVYSNQFLMSLSITALSFFMVVVVSFLIEIILNLLEPLTNLSNVSYILLGILSSVLISSTLYIFFKELSN